MPPHHLTLYEQRGRKRTGHSTRHISAFISAFNAYVPAV